MEIIKTIIDGAVQWLDVGLSIVGAFALIATKTPNKVDDRIGQILMDVINFLGANLGKAKNNKDE